MSANSIVLWTAMRPMLVDTLTASANRPEVMRRPQAEHQGIFDAIRTRDAAKAADRIEQHIDGFYTPDGGRGTTNP